MKKVTAILLALALALSLAACGSHSETPAASAPTTSQASPEAPTENTLYGKPSGEVNLNVWYAVSGVTGETFAAQVEAYMAENPNIHIELSYAGSYSDAAEKISANLLTGTAPDVALIAAGPLYTGGRGNYTIEALIEDPAFDKDDIYEGVWDYARFADRICAIPYGISVPVLYYNKLILEKVGIDIDAEAPATWEELYDLAKRAQQSGNINGSEAFYGFEVSDAPWLFKSMLRQNGNGIVSVDGETVEPIYNDEKAFKVATLWQRFAADGVMPVGEHSNAEKTFLAGNCAFIVASSIRLARWTDSDVVEYGVLPMPSFEEPSVALGGNVLVTFSEDQDKLAASWDLIKYLTNAENHTAFSLATGYLPIHRSALESDAVIAAFEEDPRRETVVHALDNAWSYSHFEQMGTMDWILGDMLGALESGKDVQSTLDKAVEDLLREM